MPAQTGPGKSYRRGITLMQAVRKFDTEEKAEKWFVKQRWPNGIACPKCGSINVATIVSRKPQPYRCRSCRKHFSVKTGSLLHSSKIPLSKWAIAFYLFSTNLKGVSSMKLHRDLGISQSAAWYMGHRIRGMWDATTERYIGPVEADETYVGGLESNKHESKKLKAGRGAIGKTPVAGVKDRATNQVSTAVVESTNKATLQEFVHSRTEPDAIVYTDEARAYVGLRRPHEAVSHSAGEYVRGEAHTNGLESHWAMLKRGIDGIYHHISPKHLDRYATEFAGRHNQRPLDTEDQMGAIARGADGKRITYQLLIGPPETRLNGQIPL